MKRFFTWLSILTLLSSCVKNVSSTITKNYPERQEGCALDVFIDNADIKRPYETIAIIDTKTGKTAFEKKGLNKVIDLARPLACQAGADGILLLLAGRTNGSGALDIGGSSNGIFKAIKYTDGGPSPTSIVKKGPTTQMEKYYEAKRLKEQARKEHLPKSDVTNASKEGVRKEKEVRKKTTVEQVPKPKSQSDAGNGF